MPPQMALNTKQRNRPFVGFITKNMKWSPMVNFCPISATNAALPIIYNFRDIFGQILPVFYLRPFYKSAHAFIVTNRFNDPRPTSGFELK